MPPKLPPRPAPASAAANRLQLVHPQGDDDLLRLDPAALRPAFRPIANLEHGTVAGYEVVLSHDGSPFGSPRRWGRSVHVRRSPALEARFLTRALEARSSLPADCFLAVDISGSSVVAGDCVDVLVSAAPLERVVIVLGDSACHEGDLAAALEPVRRAGATVCVDQTAAASASLRDLLALRPELVRVGGDFVSEIDRDHAKAAVVEALGALASRMDAWMIAADVPGPAELRVLRRLGVPLAQGPVLGPERSEMDPAVPEAARAVAEVPARSEDGPTVAPLVEQRPALPWGASLEVIADAFLDDPRHDFVVLVDERRRPLALAERAALLRGEPYERPVTRVSPSSSPAAIARRAIARPQLERFHPLVACDREGVFRGVVRVEQLLDALASS